MLLRVAEMVLPVLILLGIGCWSNRTQVFDLQGLAGIKSVIGDILLPVVLFNAFFTAQYSMTVVLLFVAVYAGFGIALAIGFGLRRLVAPYGRFFPFLMASAEGGMLGYALYGLLTGEQSGFAAVDLGQTVFAYTAFLGTLKAVDGGALSPKDMVKIMAGNRCFLGMLLGIILGATGVGGLVLSSQLGELVRQIIAMITAPTSALVLLVVGYELNLSRRLLRPVLTTVALRLLVMGDLSLDCNSHALSCGERSLRLGFKEYEVMRLLLVNQGSVIAKETLITKVWGMESEAEDNNVEVYISFLRKKLSYLNSKVVISTIRKAGYFLENSQPQEEPSC